MKLHAPVRQPIRIRLDRGPSVCEQRGHCGPFFNEGYYDVFPEALWHGMGDCVECGTTRHVASERSKSLESRSAA